MQSDRWNTAANTKDVGVLIAFQYHAYDFVELVGIIVFTLCDILPRYDFHAMAF